MKTKMTFVLIIIFGIVITSCKQKEEKVEVEEVKIDLINNEFPEAKQEVKSVLDSLFISIQKRETEELLSYHLYSDKFTEFRDGLPRTGSSENEEYERQLIKNISSFDYNLGDLKIDIFDRVAIVTFNADFRPTIGENVVQLWRQGTIVFVKNNGVWRITHEHFSPMNVEESE
ncbi:nuclear transport factor 2 family protein [Cellulophaga baltica]|uniref:YybH family protein n=1 Tax=Cellulophaga TaxID=104264 RepID=UPI001C068FDE|nr:MULTISPECIES: nuclear transport factor 2 family protein [Cellulophaga]MBU2997847.1 nuclear transport factor 2 family protein [Cellulophaga baltica]MDO6769246.1 nuclear transport factor 2 family protein [Cellulophaga sp. 1_MG-2023]